MIQKRFKRLRRPRPDRPIQPDRALIFWSQLTWFESLEVWLKLGSICSYCGKTKDEAVKGGGMTLVSPDKPDNLKVARLCGDCAELICRDILKEENSCWNKQNSIDAE